MLTTTITLVAAIAGNPAFEPVVWRINGEIVATRHTFATQLPAGQHELCAEVANKPPKCITKQLRSGTNNRIVINVD